MKHALFTIELFEALQKIFLALPNISLHKFTQTVETLQIFTKSKYIPLLTGY